MPPRRAWEPPPPGTQLEVVAVTQGAGGFRLILRWAGGGANGLDLFIVVQISFVYEQQPDAPPGNDN